MDVSDIDTPALVVDLDILERNLARVADYARGHGLRLRPHTKTSRDHTAAQRGSRRCGRLLAGARSGYCNAV